MASKSNKTFILILPAVICLLAFITYTTYSRYAVSYDGDLKIDYAKWAVKLNGNDFKEYDGTFTSDLTLVPSSRNNYIKDGKIAPGDEGVFDILIDPSNTEVSVKLEISFNLDDAPKGLKINGYSLDDGKSFIKLDDPFNPELERIIKLGDRSKLDSTDVQKILFYWEWDVNDTEIPNGSSIKAEIVASQILE